MTLLTGFGGEELYVRELLGQFESRVPDGLQFALSNRVLLLRSASGALRDKCEEWADDVRALAGLIMTDAVSQTDEGSSSVSVQA